MGSCVPAFRLLAPFRDVYWVNRWMSKWTDKGNHSTSLPSGANERLRVREPPETSSSPQPTLPYPILPTPPCPTHLIHSLVATSTKKHSSDKTILPPEETLKTVMQGNKWFWRRLMFCLCCLFYISFAKLNYCRSIILVFLLGQQSLFHLKCVLLRSWYLTLIRGRPQRLLWTNWGTPFSKAFGGWGEGTWHQGAIVLQFSLQ